MNKVHALSIILVELRSSEGEAIFKACSQETNTTKSARGIGSVTVGKVRAPHTMVPSILRPKPTFSVRRRL